MARTPRSGLRVIGLALAIATLTLTACGPLRRERSPARLEPSVAETLARQLDSIERRFQVGGGACNDIVDGRDPNTVPVAEAIARVRDPELRSALKESFDHLFALVREQCVTTPSEPKITPTTPPPPITTETTPTETSTEMTTPTTTQPAPAPGSESGGAGALAPAKPNKGKGKGPPKQAEPGGGAIAPPGGAGNEGG